MAVLTIALGFRLIDLKQREQSVQIQTPATPTVSELLKLVNQERVDVGVDPLYIDARLNKSAQEKSKDLLLTGVFSHQDALGKHGIEKAFIYMPECKSGNENLTQNTIINDSTHAINAWVASSSHYTEMVNPKYEYTGFGISGNYIVQHFCDVD